MRSVFTSFFLILVVPLATFASDFGVAATSESGISGALGRSVEFSQVGRAALTLVLTPAEEVAFRVHGGYQYTLSDPLPLDWDNFFVDELSYTLGARRADARPADARFSITVGRFPFSDLTGSIYEELLDGGRIAMSDQLRSVSVTAGYTGLLFAHDTTVLVSNADAAERADADPFGPPRAVAELVGRTRFPAAGITLSVALLAQFDLHDPSTLAQPGDTTLTVGGPVSTQYQSVALSGQFARSFSYVIGSTLTSGRTLSFVDSEYGVSPIRALLAYGLLEYAPVTPLEPILTLDLLFASGDADATAILEGNTAGAATAFIPITNRSLGFVKSPVLSNLARFNLRGSLRPLGGMQGANLADAFVVSGFGSAYLQPTSGVSPFADGASGYTGIYLGSEAGVGLTVIPASFLSIGVDGALFFPAASAFGSGDLLYRGVATVRIAY